MAGVLCDLRGDAFQTVRLGGYVSCDGDQVAVYLLLVARGALDQLLPVVCRARWVDRELLGELLYRFSPRCFLEHFLAQRPMIYTFAPFSSSALAIMTPMPDRACYQVKIWTIHRSCLSLESHQWRLQ